MNWTERLQNHKSLFFEKNPSFYRYYEENPYGEGVTIKQIKVQSSDEEENAAREGPVALNNPHPNICECYGWEREDVAGSSHCFFYVFYEHLPRNVYDELTERAKSLSFYSEAELWAIFTQTLSALSFLEKRGIAHRDIKTQNLFLDPQGNIKVGNFSFAKKVENNAPAVNTLLGSMPYCSPILRENHLKNDKEVARLQHDVFKSDVYSLGMVMLHLSLLEIPVDLSLLVGLQVRIDNRIDSLDRYSAEWRNLLKWLLRVNEEYRPRFSQVQASFEERPPFSDDDPLAPQESGADIPEPLTLSVVCGMPFVRVSVQMIDEEVPCMVTVKVAPEVNFHLGGIDLVCVIDQSGSMLDECTLLLVQTALSDLVDLLGEHDRMSIVGFSDTAERMCPLTICTAAGKSHLKAVILELRARDLTNIPAGFLMGLDILKQRRYPNQSCSLLLFTDGQSNVGESPAVCVDSLQQCGLERFSVCCFGYGKQIDTETLQVLSERSNGVFQRISSPEEIQCAFVSACRSITRVVARDLRISMNVLAGSVPCDIVKVYSEDGVGFFQPKLGAGQQVSFIFVLKPRYTLLTSPVRFPTVQVTLTYKDSEGAESSKFTTLDVKFIKWGPQAVHVAEVDAHWYQARGVACLRTVKSLASSGEVKKAMQHLDKEIKELNGSRYARHQAVQPVLSQLKDWQDKIEAEGEEHLRSFGQYQLQEFLVSEVPGNETTESTAGTG